MDRIGSRICRFVEEKMIDDEHDSRAFAVISGSINVDFYFYADRAHTFRKQTFMYVTVLYKHAHIVYP